MSDAEEAPIATVQWCAGRRYAGEQLLSDAEREDVRSRADRNQRALLWIGAAPVAVLIGVIEIAARMPAVLDTAGLVLALLVSALLVVGVPVWILSFRDRLQKWSALSADARAGKALRFEEPRTEDSDIVPSPALLVLPITLMGFPEGALPSVAKPVTIVEVAEGPGYALRVPISVADLASSPPLDFDLLRRTLSVSEQHELEIAIRKLRRPGFEITFAIGLLLLLIVTARLDAWTWTNRLFASVLGAAMCLLAIGGYVRGLLLTAKMRQDARTGWAITAKPREAMADGVRRTEEFLPHSYLLWTVNGRPAEWRDLRRAPLMLRR